MSIQIFRDKLLKPLGFVNGVVESRHTMPILANLLLEAKNGQIKLTSTDLELQISIEVENEVKKDFSTTVQAKKLLDIYRSFPENALIEMTENSNRLELSYGKTKFNLQTLPIEDYPRMTKNSGQSISINMPCAQIKNLLSQVSFCMAMEDIRYFLNGVLFKVSGNKLFVVATDGHRLGANLLELENDYTEHEIIIPRKAVMELIKLIDHDNGNINIEIIGNQVIFKFSNISLISKSIDGKFPDYDRVIPKQNENIFSFDRLNMLSALQQVAVIMANEKFKGIHMLLGNNNLKFTSHNSQGEDAEIELAVDYSGSQLDIGFNVTYLMDVLNSLDAEEITFSIADAMSSCLITFIPKYPNYKYVVMPLRI